MSPIKHQINYRKLCYLAIVLIVSIPGYINAQDTSSSILNINKLKIVQKAKNLVDSANSKINKKVYDRINDSLKNITKKGNAEINNLNPKEEFDERPLPYERLLNTKYTLTRRAYQNTVSQFNYLFNAEEELKEIIQKSRTGYKEDYGSLLSFYDYDLATTSKNSMDSIIYRCNANIVLHDLRSNWVDDAYLLLAKSYLFHRNFDTAESILQFINYSFDENGTDQPIGSNLRNETGKFSIANKDENSIWKNRNIRNESMLWQARNYIESGKINEALSLLQLLKADMSFPKRLHPFLSEQFALVYYNMESYELAAQNLIDALPNAMDDNAKSRWYFLIAQLWQKAHNTSNAYYWYQKATQFSPNPIIGVYATINLIRIESEKTNRNWQLLAKDLEIITKKEKYKPYKDIIYYEMAQLAIQNKSFDKANEWLITAIKNNYDNPKQKESAFELMGDINYNENKFAIAKIAYDSLNSTIKTHPQYEKITVRKKWLGTIVQEINNIETEDTLQFIYNLPSNQQIGYAKAWKKNRNDQSKYLKNIFSENNKDLTNLKLQSQLVSNTINTNYSQGNFYFEGSNTIAQGKQSFIQKWGERPNIDNWRRKTSNAIVNISNVNNNIIIDSSMAIIKSNEATLDSITHLLISSDNEFKESSFKWNKAALTTAQTFLLQLNDFEKAKIIYELIIKRNIDPTITERAMLDLASQYVHIGDFKTSDSIIQIVTTNYPNGMYMQKKQNASEKKNTTTLADNIYKEAYFLSQIGNWNAFENLANTNYAILLKSKWFSPLQFLKVKMYAQLNQDNKAITILDSIIRFSNNEILKEKANSLLFDIKNRKSTEHYLSNLDLDKLTNNNVISAPQNLVKDTAIKELQKGEMKKSMDSIKATNEIVSNSRYHFDKLETHYIAIITNNTTALIASKIKDSLLNNHKNEFNNLKIISTISELQEKSYIIWIGPFENAASSLIFLNKVTPFIKKGLNDYLAVDKYEFATIGKGNITKIKSLDDLKDYKTFMSNNIIKL